MGTGQLLLTIGAIFLLGTAILTTNRAINDNNQVMVTTNMGLEEVALATSWIQQASDSAFDECSINGNPITSTSMLTPRGSLGPEFPGDCDDFDDLNGVTDTVWGLDAIHPDGLATGTYIRRARVYYVSQSNLDQEVVTPTWYKRLDVQVWNKDQIDRRTGRPDTLIMSTIFSYWNFN